MAVKYCEARIKYTGAQCKLHAMNGSVFCNMHDPSRDAERVIRAKKGGPKAKKIIGKLKDLKIKDTSDMAIAIKKIIEDMLRNGRLSNTSDVNVFNGLVKTAILLENNAEVPKKMKEIEALLNSSKLQLSTDKNPS